MSEKQPPTDSKCMANSSTTVNKSGMRERDAELHGGPLPVEEIPPSDIAPGWDSIIADLLAQNGAEV